MPYSPSLLLFRVVVFRAFVINCIPTAKACIVLQRPHAFAVGVAGSLFLGSIRESMAPDSSFAQLISAQALREKEMACHHDVLSFVNRAKFAR